MTNRKFMKPGNDNKSDRINFVKFWARYVRMHNDKDWSRQQNIVIDGQFNNSKK